MRKLRHAVTLRQKAPGRCAPGGQAARFLRTTQQHFTTIMLFALVFINAHSENDPVRFCSKEGFHNT